MIGFSRGDRVGSIHNPGSQRLKPRSLLPPIGTLRSLRSLRAGSTTVSRALPGCARESHSRAGQLITPTCHFAGTIVQLVFLTYSMYKGRVRTGVPWLNAEGPPFLGQDQNPSRYDLHRLRMRLHGESPFRTS